MYVSNRIGSVHFYFLYKENDLGKKNKEVIINDFKADFKMCQYMISPLSLHPTCNLYRIKNRGSFFIGSFDKASEAYDLMRQRVGQIQLAREMKKLQKQQLSQIEIPPKK